MMTRRYEHSTYLQQAGSSRVAPQPRTDNTERTATQTTTPYRQQHKTDNTVQPTLVYLESQHPPAHTTRVPTSPSKALCTRHASSTPTLVCNSTAATLLDNRKVGALAHTNRLPKTILTAGARPSRPAALQTETDRRPWRTTCSPTTIWGQKRQKPQTIHSQNPTTNQAHVVC